MVEFFKNFFHKAIGREHHAPDWYLVGIVGFLLAFGLVMLSSAGVAVGWKNFNDSYYHFKHQILFGVLPGLIFFFILARVNYQFYKKWAALSLVISIGLLILVFIPGIGAPWGTARSWVKIFGFSFQPSEIVKLTYLVYLASWLASREEKHIKDFRTGFLPFALVLAVIIILMLLEPDTGTMFIIVAASLAVYFLAGGKFFHILLLTALCAAGMAAVIKRSPYRAQRFMAFLHPELDPQGIGYHINQALWAVGSGGWLGRGFGHSRQKFAYLPEVVGDSIFAVIAEELGWLIAGFLILVFLILLFRGLKLFKQCRDPFGRYLAAGITVWLVFQAFLNIGAIIGVLPLTGVTLPFISYGGTSLAVSLAAVGILVNISRQTEKS